MSRPCPWMVGTDPSGQGGIAAVVSVYQDHGLFERWRIRYLPSHRETGWVWLFLRALLSLLGALIRGRVSLLHAHVASRGSFLRKSLLLAMARGLRVPTVFHLHGGGFRNYYAASPRWMQAWIRHSLRRSDRVLALSEAWRTFVRELVPEAQVEVLPNPVSLPAAGVRSAEVAGRLLYLGRASKSKGAFDLLMALRLARQSCPDLHLHLGGDGDLAAVQAAIEEQGLVGVVTLLGWVSGEAKEREFTEAEIFVLPSYDEGLPMAMLEAMARGKAIVATPVGGIPQLLRQEQEGLLVKPGATDELAGALMRLQWDADLRARLGDAARQRVRQECGAEHVVLTLDRVYRALGQEPD